ncbi:MAG: DUF2207 domain-containing protein [Candidatus Acidiferrales bacterium]
MMRRALPLALLLVLATAGAAARELVIESFDADLRVNSDGTLEVTETLRPRFSGQWNGIIRFIPVEYRHPLGFNYTLLLDVESISDENGNRLRYESDRERHYRRFKIWVPNANNATRTVVIRYRVRNGLRFFEEHDELYWNVTGDESDIPHESATARVHLPGGADGIRASAFTGAYGSTEQDADVQVSGTEVGVRMRRALNFREGLTIAVAWNPGLVHRPGTLEKIVLFLRSNWPLFIPFGVFAGMFWLWWTRGRDPSLRSIAAQYAPPDELTPAELGTLIDNKPDMRDITSTLVDLAVRGYLGIEEKTDKVLGLFSSKDYIFERRRPDTEWGGLKTHERELLRCVFRGKSQVELSDLENDFYRDLPGIRDRIFDQLLGRKYYLRRPDRVRNLYLVIAIVVGIVSVWGGGFVAAILGQQPLPFIVGGVFSAGIIFVFAWFMPARTLQGARTLEKVLGFEEFLARVESDRFSRMVKTPEMFERFLPYAMALGVEKNWVKAFEDIYRQPPQWYRRDFQTFQPRTFVRDLSQMSNRAARAMASQPRSSGGSGSGGGGGGGGFSGGGFGGGGTSGF